MDLLIAAGGGGSTEILRLVLGSMIWAEIVGVPVAWLKLRRSEEWRSRSARKGKLDALARYVGRITAMVGFWSIAILLGALLGSVVA